MEQIQQYFDRMKNIEENLLTYFEKCDEDKNAFFNYLDEKKITENKSEFKSFLYLIVQLANNYHRTSCFYPRIDQILIHIKSSIQKHFQNSEIFHIFHSNKRILLFLIQQKLLTIDQGIVDCFIQPKFLKKSYIEYFFPEVEQFLDESFKNKVKKSNKDSLDQFNEKRQIGENDSYICSLIRNDQVVDFITYLEKNTISPSSVINRSIYETNQFLLNKDKKVSLIEYSAFYGAQQIFVYLNKQNVELKSKIWPFVIHGKNPDLIHMLEENHVQTLSNSYQYLIVEAIKCHHNEIANYFSLNFCQKERLYNQYLFKKHFKYYNFNHDIYAQEIINNSVRSDWFYFLCKYDYNFVVEALLSLQEININRQYKVYKPNRKLKDIVLSIDIKNGQINKIPKEEEDDDYYMKRDEEEPNDLEYKEANNYYIYNYDLEIITALFIAVRKGNIDIIRLLLNTKEIGIGDKSKKYYKKSYCSDDEFYTIQEERILLHEAIESGNVDCVQLLLSLINVDDYSILSKKYTNIDGVSTANIYIKEEEHKKPLILIAELGYSEIMKLLLSQKKVQINEKSLKIEIFSGGCISYSSSENRIEKTPLHTAILNKNINIVKLCLDDPDIDINITYDIFHISEWHEEFKSLFQKDEKDEIKMQRSSLYLAVVEKDIDIVKLLLNQPNIDINMKSILKKNKYDHHIQSRTALHEAAKNNQIEIINLLLQHPKIDINALDENQQKPIALTKDAKIKELFNNFQK